MYVVIRAGGVGTRLWPLSRQHQPKQLHALTSVKTLLQLSIERVVELVPADHIFVSCNERSAAAVREQLGLVPLDNLIIEPATRDTAAAVGLETVMIAKRDPQAIIASLGSDHVIANIPEFQRVLEVTASAIERQPDHIACIGIAPKQPDTGYGYIELGQEISPEVYQVQSFKEKPDATTAEQFIAAGNYLWNANMFVWRADTLLKLYEQHLPTMYQQLLTLQQHPEQVATVYPQLEKIAVDYGIIEKAQHIVAVAGDFGWNDIGDWARLKQELVEDTKAIVSHGDHLDLDSTNVMVFSDTKRLVATIGVQDLIIVDTPDALLICSNKDSQKVKQLVEQLHQQERHDLLWDGIYGYSLAYVFLVQCSVSVLPITAIIRSIYLVQLPLRFQNKAALKG